MKTFYVNVPITATMQVQAENENEAIKIVERAVDEGIDFFLERSRVSAVIENKKWTVG